MPRKELRTHHNIQHNDIQHTNSQYTDCQPYDTQPNRLKVTVRTKDTKSLSVSIMMLIVLMLYLAFYCNTECRYAESLAECHSNIVMLSFILSFMLNVVMLSVVAPGVTNVKSFMIQPWAFGQIHPNPKSCIYAFQWMRGFRLGLLS